MAGFSGGFRSWLPLFELRRGLGSELFVLSFVFFHFLLFNFVLVFLFCSHGRHMDCVLRMGGGCWAVSLLCISLLFSALSVLTRDRRSLCQELACPRGELLPCVLGSARRSHGRSHVDQCDSQCELQGEWRRWLAVGVTRMILEGFLL